MQGLSLVVASGGHSSSWCAGLSLSRPLLLRSTGSRRAGSVIVAHRPSCSVACGIFPDQGSNPCPLHWQADCQPLCHQGSPFSCFLRKAYITMNFPLRMTFAVSHRFCMVVFSLSFVSRYFLISSLISSLTHWFFNRMLFSLHVSIFFSHFFFCG